MYICLSITTVPEPLSAGFMIMSVRFDKVFSAVRSSLVRLSDMRMGCMLFMSSSMLSM